MRSRITRRVQSRDLSNFCIRVFQKLGVSKKDAQITADVLVASDLRGIESHGVAHLQWYVNDLRAGLITARPRERIIVETKTTTTIDADAGLGPPVSYRAMKRAIKKAIAVGSGFVSVRNSNHYGIAGYYAMMALRHNCIGFSMTNGHPVVVPTFGSSAMLSTNPIAIAIPAGQDIPFVLDMATSTVALGKLEIAERMKKSIPVGWAVDERGHAMQDPHRALKKIRKREGGLLPLGGAGEKLRGYKGYGLALWGDIFSGILSGAAYSTHTYPKDKEGKLLPANIGHFFGVWRIDAFRPIREFKKAVDDLYGLLRGSPKSSGARRIYIPGEKEHEATMRNRRDGLFLNSKVVEELQRIAEDLKIDFELF